VNRHPGRVKAKGAEIWLEFSSLSSSILSKCSFRSLLLDHGHFTVVTQDALAGEFCISDLADELLVPFFQSFEEEGFLEVPGFVFQFESF
jgi:hypothetical protein